MVLRKNGNVLVPSAGHGDEADGEDGLFFDLPALFAQENEVLVHAAAYGDDHAAAVAELLDEVGWNFVWRAGHNDGVERRLFGPALVTDAVTDLSVVIAEPLERLPCHCGEGLDDFDGVEFGAGGSENRGLVAGASANFQNLFAGLRADGFGHEGDDVGLRDGLAVADGKRVVHVGLAAQTQREKIVERHSAHGLEGGGIGDAAV